MQFSDCLKEARAGLLAAEAGPSREIALSIIDRWLERREFSNSWDEINRSWHKNDAIPLNPRVFIDYVIKTRLLAERHKVAAEPDFEKKLLARATYEWRFGDPEEAGKKKKRALEHSQQRQEMFGRQPKLTHVKWFASMWRQQFKNFCGQPFDATVAELTEIAFGESYTAEAVRGSQRPTRRAERYTRNKNSD